MTPAHEAMRPRAGLVLGARYELVERIATGGMGEVWVALDRRLGRRVAAKVLRTELVGDERFLGRLRAEARNSAGLRHPNLASLLDHGEQGGSGYLVMELVPGETLARRLEREHTLPVAELLDLLVQACRGLHAVHCSGVVHRDVKPANMMITPEGRLKLTDFGISLGADQAPMTAAGMVMGTAQYLPPEQAMGRAATAAGDLYALGIVAYEALVGRRPYTGATQVDIAFAHVRTPLPPLPGTVPEPVRDVVERMLAKDPAGRPANALVCARELEALAVALGAGTPARVGVHAAPPARPTALETPRRGAARPAHEPGAPWPAASRPATTDQAVAPDRSSGRDRAALRAPRRLLPAVDPPGRGRHGASFHAVTASWRVPTWAEMAADRLWVAALAVVLAVLMIVAVVVLGTLRGADTSSTGRDPAHSYSATTEKDD